MTRTGIRRWRWQQTRMGELAAEFLGTFIIIAFGDGVVAMAVAALNQSGRGRLSGDCDLRPGGESRTRFLL